MGFGRDDKEPVIPETSLLQNGQVKIKGLLRECKPYQKEGSDKTTYEHIFVEAAKDEYDFPKSFPVRSDVMLGPVGEVFEVIANIECWRSKGFYNIVLRAA